MLKPAISASSRCGIYPVEHYTVRTCPPLPIKLATTQCPSLSCRSSNRKIVAFALRRTHPMSSASKA